MKKRRGEFQKAKSGAKGKIHKAWHEWLPFRLSIITVSVAAFVVLVAGLTNLAYLTQSSQKVLGAKWDPDSCEKISGGYCSYDIKCPSGYYFTGSCDTNINHLCNNSARPFCCLKGKAPVGYPKMCTYPTPTRFPRATPTPTPRRNPTCDGGKGTCFVNNSCGAYRQEVDAYCPRGYRICCEAKPATTHRPTPTPTPRPNHFFWNWW